MKKKILVILAAFMLAVTLMAPIQARADAGVQPRATVVLESWVEGTSFIVRARLTAGSSGRVRAYSNGSLGPWVGASTASVNLWSRASSTSRANNVRGFDLG